MSAPAQEQGPPPPSSTLPPVASSQPFFATVAGVLKSTATGVTYLASFGQYDDAGVAFKKSVEETVVNAKATDLAHVVETTGLGLVAAATNVANVATLGQLADVNQASQNLNQATMNSAQQTVEHVGKTANDIANHTPLVGQAKALLHYQMGNVPAGDKALAQSNKSTVVAIAGLGGTLAAGPFGTVVAVVATSEIIDKVTADLAAPPASSSSSSSSSPPSQGVSGAINTVVATSMKVAGAVVGIDLPIDTDFVPDVDADVELDVEGKSNANAILKWEAAMKKSIGELFVDEDLHKQRERAGLIQEEINLLVRDPTHCLSLQRNAKTHAAAVAWVEASIRQVCGSRLGDFKFNFGENC